MRLGQFGRMILRPARKNTGSTGSIRSTWQRALSCGRLLARIKRAPATAPMMAAAAALSMLFCGGGCAWIDAHGPALGGTAAIIGKKVAAFGCQIGLQALSYRDARDKMDLLDGAAQAVRTMDWSAAVTGDDIGEVLDLWLPDRTHWDTLAERLGAMWDAARVPVDRQPEALEEIAAALNDAAAAGRKAAAAKVLAETAVAR